MASINQHIWTLLRKDLAIQKDLQRKIINIRALAKYIIKTYGLNASLDSVISSIRRFETQEQFKKEEEQLVNVFSDASITTKNNVVCYTLSLNTTQLLEKIKSKNKSSWRIVTGSNESKIVVEQKDAKQVEEIFTKSEIKNVEPDLSEISVMLTEKASPTKGVAARITGEIALVNINISELLICQPEFLIYVKQRDVVKAYESVLKLVNR